MNPCISGAAGCASTPKDTVTVGGAAMYPAKDIIENASESADHILEPASKDTPANIIPTCHVVDAVLLPRR